MKKLAIVLGMLFVIGGCNKPPVGTVWVDTDNNGLRDMLVVDKDADGQPDIDEAGNMLPIDTGLTKKQVEMADKLDKTGPDVLAAAGGITTALGGGIIGVILTGLGALWRNAKIGRQVTNLIATVQAGRSALANKDKGTALKLLDDALSKQLPETVKMVAEVKRKLSLQSAE